MISKPMRERDTIVAIAGVDQRLRECVQYLWLALPKEQKNLDDLEGEFLRLVLRALKDFKEDFDHFNRHQL